MKLIIAVSRGTGENIENGSRCFCHANVLCLARQPREGASPLTCRSHETPGGELARTLHPCLRETFHVLRCLIIMWYHIRSWLLVNHVISHAFPIATKSWYHTRTEILTPLDLTHSPLEILPKNAFWSFTTKPFTGRTLRGLLIQMQNIKLAKFRHAQKAKFRVLGFKSDTEVLTFTFRFLSSLIFSLSLPHFFFFCWAFSRLAVVLQILLGFPNKTVKKETHEIRIWISKFKSTLSTNFGKMILRSIAKLVIWVSKSKRTLVCKQAVFSVVTQRFSLGGLRDDTKNGCLLY